MQVLPLDPDLGGANGKVRGVITGLRAAQREHVVLADDDVHYDLPALGAMARLLGSADVVVPQNVLPATVALAHAWDRARRLLNRAFGSDHPGTMGVRRSTIVAIGGYDGDVLFENLELIRTIRAVGGRLVRAPWLYVGRVAPSTRTFLEQRVRQAYEELAQPLKLGGMLSIGPLMVAGIARRSWGWLLVGAGATVALAEVGRQRDRGRRAFPATCSWFAARLGRRARRLRMDRGGSAAAPRWGALPGGPDPSRGDPLEHASHAVRDSSRWRARVRVDAWPPDDVRSHL